VACGIFVISSANAYAQGPPRSFTLKELPGADPNERARFLRQLQSADRREGNCPAVAAATQRFIESGVISPARRRGGVRGGYANCGEEIAASLDRIISLVRAEGHGFSVVLLADDGVDGPDGQQHAANLVNIHGVVYYIDAYNTTQPVFTDNPRPWLSWATRFSYSRDYRPHFVPREFEATFRCPGGGGSGSRKTLRKCGGENGCAPSASRSASSLQPSPAKSLTDSSGPGGDGCPEPIAGAEGRSHGDPHLVTFDGHRYNFQTVGEYVLARSRDGFEVQTRQERVPRRNVSLNTAVAFRVGRSRIAIYAKDFPGISTAQSPVYVDGRPVLVGPHDVTVDDVTISSKAAGNFTLSYSTGHKATITLQRIGEYRFLNVALTVPASRPGHYEGLLGDRDGEAANDLRIRDGSTIPINQSTYGAWRSQLNRVSPVPIPIDRIMNEYFKSLYRRFGDSWRVPEAESLFDYGPGQSTRDFTDIDFPRTFVSLASISPKVLRDAERVCAAQRVEKELLEGCIFDVAVTGDEGFAKALSSIVKDAVKRRAEDEVRKRIPGPFRGLIP
jgi:hypothetical protein